ncbi:hypothetical protein H1O16_gp014 [Burkholderia phage BcepSaruman]|uniref:Uncharacterized protein n=1 Tax=Burkholderia phage BcepSaruman TaxID=2530032 RepID=A0A4D5ZDV0_9CAUD|nr:hypothetical protein H1O16_gp014 [Burkholderia phage BcepSaruman]QBX06427.1 hypothetical protein BcepSaruman_014 [Burkholderia phage BcepSaruman]
MARIETNTLNIAQTRIALTNAGHVVPAMCSTLGAQRKALRAACARVGIAPVMGYDEAEVMARARAAWAR